MARTQRQRTSQFLQLGIFAVGTAILAFATFYLLTRFGPGERAYRIGVHFPRASGVGQGSQVFFSGVNIGSVEEIRLLPDNSVDLILGIENGTDIPKASRFSVRPSFTGSAAVIIAPPIAREKLSPSPTPAPPHEILEKRILPVAEQPVGSDPLGIEDLLAQSQQLMHRSSRIMSSLRGSKKGILGNLQGSRSNALALSQELRGLSVTSQASLRSTAAQIHANVSRAQGALRARNGRKLASLAYLLKSSATTLNSSVSSLHQTTSDPQVRANMTESAGQMRSAMSNLDALRKQMHGASDAQTRLQLADAAAQLHAALERIGSIVKH